MRTLSIAMSVLILLFATACATVDSGGVPRGIREVPLERAGIVFGSVGIGAPSPFTQQGLRYRAKGAEESALILFRQSGLIDTPIEFSEGSVKGSVFVIRLPPGDYELHNVHFFVNRGQFGTTTFTSKSDFSVPFRVTEGTATYLGEFLTHSVSGKNVFGMSVPGGGYFVVSNKIDRDFSFLAKKGFPIARERVNDSTVNPASVRLPIFQHKPVPSNSAAESDAKLPPI